MRINVFYLCLFVFVFLLGLCLLTHYREGLETSGPFMDVVVARYAEDLSWIKGTIDESIYNQMFIYNKGDPFNNDLPKSTVIQLTNLGREGHTYLTHIIDHYDRLPGLILFVPGSCATNPSKMSRLKHILEHLKNNKTSVILGDKNKEGIDIANAFTLDNYTVSSPENQTKNPESKLKPSAFRPLSKWFEKNFGEDEKLNCVSFFGVVAASRVDIQKRPKEWYEALRDEMAYPNPETGHYIERTWKHIFSMADENCIG